MKPHIDSLLRTLVIKKASDLHLQVGTPPYLRINGSLLPTDLKPLTQDDMEQFLKHVLTNEMLNQFNSYMSIDFAYSMPGVARFRVNAYRQRGENSMSVRFVPWDVMTLDELKLPKVIKHLLSFPTGLVLVTGPSGSGKSTTLAAMIDYINTSREGQHIITIEDPIEFLHSNKKCLINQREVGKDTHTFTDALRDGLREDPNVILLGEMRDPETIALAVTAAETGQLVLGTLHTADASQTVDRIVDIFPPQQQLQIRLQVAMLLRGVVSQRLLCRQDGHGRVAAFEVMVVHSGISGLIRENKTVQIYSAIQTGSQYEMQTMEKSLQELVRQGLVTKEEALSKSSRPSELHL